MEDVLRRLIHDVWRISDILRAVGMSETHGERKIEGNVVEWLGDKLDEAGQKADEAIGELEARSWAATRS